MKNTTSENGKSRAAAIGVGSLGRHHARNYAELAREGRIEFAGVCDIDAETAAKIAAENNAPVFYRLAGAVGQGRSGFDRHADRNAL